tara:strand:+ start:939 stop:1289 length:351 start_codon:yes stop_codon:yes gene_type:complete
MTIPELYDLSDVAKRWDVSASALRKVADEAKLTIIIGRKVKLDPKDLPELLKQCQDEQRDRACTGATEKTAHQYGKSAMDRSGSRPAQTAAAMLKRSSKSTSLESAGQLVPFSRRK